MEQNAIYVHAATSVATIRDVCSFVFQGPFDDVYWLHGGGSRDYLLAHSLDAPRAIDANTIKTADAVLHPRGGDYGRVLHPSRGRAS